MQLSLDKSSLPVYQALASQTRLSILSYLSYGPETISSLAEKLEISKPVLSRHMGILRDAGLVTIPHDQDIVDSRVKQFILKVDNLSIEFPEHRYLQYRKHERSIRLGYYSDFSVQSSCGLAAKDHLIGKMDDVTAFALNDRIQASLLWLNNGYIEYKIPNILANDEIPQMLELSLEISSEYPVSNNNWPSDITFWINGTDIGTWTCPGNFSDTRGRLTPRWWSSDFSQYGLLKHIRINGYDTSIDSVPISPVTIDALKLDSSPFLTLRIGVKENAKNNGGLTIFGEYFGNHAQDINISLYYSEKGRSEEKH